MKTAIVIPTYNEKNNIGVLINKILRLDIKDMNIIVVDDRSPDGTGNIVKDISKKDKRVSLLSRKGKKGRGIAGKAGFKKALEMQAGYIIEMDGDLSHDPRYIPTLLNHVKNYDVVIGSRFIKGGSDVERSTFRKILSLVSVNLVRLILSIDVKDPNSGYRCFSSKAISSIIDKIASSGTEVVQEMIYLLDKERFKMKEIPIRFKERRSGKSTKNIIDILNTLIKVIGLRLRPKT